MMMSLICEILVLMVAVADACIMKCFPVFRLVLSRSILTWKLDFSVKGINGRTTLELLKPSEL